MVEVNFDGLVGPTHHFAGLAHGNQASTQHRGAVSNPRAAALEGLAKMETVAALGAPAAVLPPPMRPRLDILATLGFGSRPAQSLAAAPDALLSSVYSASAMWRANAATITPSADAQIGAQDARCHLSVANLTTHFHRALEASETLDLLREVFFDEAFFAVHAPLPAHGTFGDEGAANHTRLVTSQGALHLFVHGDGPNLPTRYPARHTHAASAAIARRHGLAPEQVLHLQQAPAAIDAGVFHNDVIAVGHERWLFAHEAAFAEGEAAFETIRGRCGPDLHLEVVRSGELSLEEAVRCYLFNSQLITPQALPRAIAEMSPQQVTKGDATSETQVIPSATLPAVTRDAAQQVASTPDAPRAHGVSSAAPHLVAPSECAESPAVQALVRRWLDSGALSGVTYVNLRESMWNGGGPACLRLRVPLTAKECECLPPNVWLTPARAAHLRAAISTHYRDRLALADLRDPAFAQEAAEAHAAVRDAWASSL